MTCKRALMAAAAVLPAMALGACSLAPKYVAPAPPVPHLLAGRRRLSCPERSALPAVSYSEIFRDPRLQPLIARRSQQPRPARRRRQYRSGPRAGSRGARQPVPRNRRQRRRPPHTEQSGKSGGTTGTASHQRQSGGGTHFRASRRHFEFRARPVRPPGQCHRIPARHRAWRPRPRRAPFGSGWSPIWRRPGRTYAADKDLLTIAQQTAEQCPAQRQADQRPP